MENIKQNTTRTKNVVSLIWIVLILEILLYISSIIQKQIIFFSDKDYYLIVMAISINNNLRLVLSISQLSTFIISVFVFIMWFRRAYFNLHQISNNLSYSEGWAAWSWFIPGINLYTPFEIMRDLFKESKKQLLKQGKEIKFSYNHMVVGWWWALVIITFTFTQFTFYNFDISSKPILSLKETNSLIVGHVLRIILAVLTIFLIRKYSKAEQLLFGKNS